MLEGTGSAPGYGNGNFMGKNAKNIHVLIFEIMGKTSVGRTSSADFHHGVPDNIMVVAARITPSIVHERAFTHGICSDITFAKMLRN